jgi:AraC-like DNA-binding protein
MDALSQVLRSLRLRGSIYAAWDMSAPWGLAFKRGEYAPFHLVEAGSAWLILADGRRVRLEAGDVSAIFDGSAHRICDAPSSWAEPIDSAMRGRKKAPVRAHRYGGGGPRTRIICGKFAVDERESVPTFWRQLPGLVHIRPSARTEPTEFPVTFELLAKELRGGEPGSERAASLLTETLFIQVLRAVLAQEEGRSSGWLHGLRDPQIAAALALIHAEPETRWTLETLARRSGLSRSVFAHRFHTVVGKPPMTYLTDWRLTLAGRWLRESGLSVAEIFQRLGYRSAAAFHRAFKGKFGVAPSAYRRASPETDAERAARRVRDLA